MALLKKTRHLIFIFKKSITLSPIRQKQINESGMDIKYLTNSNISEVLATSTERIYAVTEDIDLGNIAILSLMEVS